MNILKRYMISAVCILALVGLLTELIKNPLALLSKALMTIGIIAVLYFLFQWLLSKRYTTHIGPTRQQIQRAKKTSQRPKKVRTNQNAHHLTVIEGKKNKKKYRAFF